MDGNDIRTEYLFSNQAHRDKMVMEALIRIEKLEQENAEMKFRLYQLQGHRGVPSQLKEMEERARRPKIIS